MKKYLISLFCLLSMSAFAQESEEVNAIFKGVDSNQKVILKHDAIRTLEMPAMTMKYKYNGKLDSFFLDEAVIIKVAKKDGSYHLIDIRKK